MEEDFVHNRSLVMCILLICTAVLSVLQIILHQISSLHLFNFQLPYVLFGPNFNFDLSPELLKIDLL